MPTSRERCEHICTAIDATIAQITHRSLSNFLTDEALRSACFYRLIVIGEAANLLLAVLPRALMVGIPNLDNSLRYSYRLRTSLAADYHQVDFKLVWNTIQAELRPLRVDVEAVKRLLP